MKNRKILSILLAAALMISALALMAPSFCLTAAANAETEADHYPVTINTYDYEKNPIQVTFQQCPQKVICTNQSQTELMLYFGLDEYIAGMAYLDGAVRDDLKEQYDALAASGKELTVKGYPSKEVVLSLEPDFIFGWRSAFADNALGNVTEWHDLGTATMILRCSNNTVPAEERNLNAVLADIADIESTRRIVVGRELTKLHEEISSGTALQVFEDYSSRQSIKGEFAVFISGVKNVKHFDESADN